MALGEAMAQASKAGGLLRFVRLATLFVGFGWAADAYADPCKAIPDRGDAPGYLSPGSSFSGPVVYVGDGDSFCVGVGPGRTDWVEVRMADFYAPELSSPDGPAAKRALERIAMGRQVSCVAEHQSYDRIVARCELEGRSLGDLLRGEGGIEGGNGFSGGEPLSAGDGVQAVPVGLAQLGEEQGRAWMLPAAALSAAAAAGVLLVGLRPRRGAGKQPRPMMKHWRSR